jgi:hypothetical protein
MRTGKGMDGQKYVAKLTGAFLDSCKRTEKRYAICVTLSTYNRLQN